MHYIIFYDQKIVVFWSAKTACTTIKKLYYTLQNNMPDNVHALELCSRQKIPEDIKTYKFVFIIRNPYERVVSGFLNKYIKNTQFYNMLPIDTCPNFEKFIQILHEDSNYTIIEKHHFVPQTFLEFNNSIMKDLFDYHVHQKSLILIDITNIDLFYNMLEIKYKSINNRTNIQNIIREKAYLIQRDDFIIIPPYKYFYNDEIKSMVKKIYENDFNFFNQFNFNYDI